jgi:hypothetical protein
MSILEFQLHNNAIEQVDLKTTMLQDSGLVGLKGRKLMVAGGVLVDFSQSSSCYIINLSPISAREVAPLPAKSRRLRLVYDEDRTVYAVGGVRELPQGQSALFKFDYSKSFSRYSLDTNLWQSLPDLKHGVENPAAWIQSDRLYVAGGACVSGTMSIVLDTIQFCSLTTFVWQIATFVLPQPLHSLQAVLCPRGVIFFGGIDENDNDNRGTHLLTHQGYQDLARIPVGLSCAFPSYCLKLGAEVLAVNADMVLCELDLVTWLWSVRPN